MYEQIVFNTQHISRGTTLSVTAYILKYEDGKFFNHRLTVIGTLKE